jgi:Mor family transcriptional regulator
MGDRRGANSFCWKNLGDGENLEDLGLYGRITLKWVFRLIQITHMTTRKQGGKKLTTEQPNGLQLV